MGGPPSRFHRLHLQLAYLLQPSSMEDARVLHVVVFPWLAMGHFIPFLRLSEILAQKGHRVSFLSTPLNLQKLPNLSTRITFVSLDLPSVPNLPQNAESSMDIPPEKSQLLKKAFDLLKHPVKAFLRTANPDWILYDYASYWVPQLAAELRIASAYFGLFTAACLAYIGPPSVLMNGGDYRSTPEDFVGVPDWIPFESNIAYHFHEVLKLTESSGENESGFSDVQRFRVAIGESDVVVIRSCAEFEPEWFKLLERFYQKPIVQIGFLPPLMEDNETEDEDENWVGVKKWLEKQRLGSVVYVAFGTEATLSAEQLSELARGLEHSDLPFFWVLRQPPGSSSDEPVTLPEGFEERVKGRGIVHRGWAPQAKILSHDSILGFLTHCGWNSVVEGLRFGRALILLPMINDQGLNARLLEGKQLGIEIVRNEREGTFTSDSVVESVRLAMVQGEGEFLRANAMRMKGLFADKVRNDRYVDSFVRYLVENAQPKREI